MSARRRAALALLWAVLLAALAAFAAARLQTSGDLRLFMPAAQTTDQRLLLDSLGEGPGSRLLLIALSGAGAEPLADASRALREALDGQGLFRRVLNGEQGAEAFPEDSLPYRYLLSDGLAARPLDAEHLGRALRARLQDLGSPAASLIEPWLARDPTLEMLHLAERWQPAREPERRFDVWFDKAGENALLVAETEAAGFDPEAQQAALRALRAAVDEVAEGTPLRLEVSGPGAFSVLMRERTEGEATRLGLLASAAMILLMGLAYRGWRLPLLGALPLATAALAGLGCVAWLFGSVHGITLAFGFTLIGIALDYPVHLFSHRHAERSAWQDARRIGRTLAAGVVSTCLAYASFLVSGVAGLAQLAAFAIAGLLAAALSTRWLLPALMPAAAGDPGRSAWVMRLDRLPGALPQAPRWATLLAVLALAALLASPRSLWDDNLGRLTPLPQDLVQRDAELRAALRASDVRHLLVLEGTDTEALLQRCEALLPGLDGLVEAGALDDAEPPCRYLPSQRTQLERRAALPDAETLRAALEAAAHNLPFRQEAFAPFLEDVAAAREAAPLGPADLEGSPLGSRLASLLPASEPPVALIGLSGLRDVSALQRFAATSGDDLHLLDMKAASEALAATYRERMLLALSLAFALLLLALAAFLRDLRRVGQVLAPVLLAALCTAAALHLGGVAFNLFHLVALILASGLGLDYALFFQRAGRDPDERRRTLHGIGVCAVSTLLVFGLLASSSVPVLRAIGLTVALGVAFNLLLASQLAAERIDDRP
ncbi:MMPL family transporter [Pseudomarimonas salicorniae]|uniref:MMPL family transporter n=1 Tax=Pseudomarimonas salicorniae TaxID=2933270 RepID=A0ABT0GCW2_9GAMM|nr:MMPL family transporter [Lysobacter sp. CAU 1642]MCK7592366.1 MMPL family transporter [Lysobacter sp. CAU 1642]